jgi:hypothetical protein
VPHQHVTYSHHARQRMQQRSVSDQQVRATLAQPDSLRLGNQGRQVAEKSFGPSDRLRVIYIEEFDNGTWCSHIVTAFWLEEQ